MFWLGVGSGRFDPALLVSRKCNQSSFMLLKVETTMEWPKGHYQDTMPMHDDNSGNWVSWKLEEVKWDSGVLEVEEDGRHA